MPPAVVDRPPAKGKRGETPMRQMRGRLRVLNSLAILAAGALCARLVYLQVWESPKLTALARAQRTRTVNLATLRNEITDRNGAELAVSVESWSVYVQPQDFKGDPARAAAELAPLLGVDAAKLTKTLSDRHWAWLARKEDPRVAKQVRALAIPGIGLIREPKRYYPEGSLAATLLGFVGEDNEGLAGLEHDFNSLISGPKRTLTIQVDAKGNEILRDARENPLETMQTSAGKVVLTLDQAIQSEAESLLARSIQANEAADGTVIVMNPYNGDVLALATLPSYDPNHPEQASPSVMADRAVTSVFEPGSVMKPFTLAAALQLHRITPASTFACPPRLQIDKGVSIGDDVGDLDPKTLKAGVRILTPSDILKVSSNVGAAQIGLRMTDAEQRGFLVKFGFGVTTHSGLGGESPGLLPELPWRRINHATISYGQGVSVTALQLATAECALANGGLRVRPRFIRELVSADGRVLQTFPPAPPVRVVSRRVVQELVPMLVGVTSDGGTGPAARIPGYDVAGKTGTAQRIRADGRGYSQQVVATFAGFVPAEHPRIVVVASLDAPKKFHFASETTAPLFRDVAAAALRILGLEPDALAASGSAATMKDTHAPGRLD